MTSRTLFRIGNLAWLAFLLAWPGQGRADSFFMYQGRLKIGGVVPAQSSFFDVQFRLFNVPTGGIQLTDTIVQVSVLDSNGLFRALLDLGPNAFGSDPEWLELGVRRAGTSDPFAILSPRQRVGPVPTSLHAQSADVATSVAGVLSPANLPANAARLDVPQVFTVPPTFNPPSSVPFQVGNTQKVSNLNADLLDGMDATAFWRRGTNGNAELIGPNSNAKAMDFVLGTDRALRLQPGDANGGSSLVGGSANNNIATGVPGSVLAGGRNNVVSSNADYSVLSGGDGNEVGLGARGSTVGGGSRQLIGPNSSYAGIFAGYNNVVSSNAPFSGVLLGNAGKIRENSDFSVVLSGENNSVGPKATYAAVLSGGANQIQAGANVSLIGSGQQNTIHSNAALSAIMAGQLNQLHEGASRSFVGGGDYNEIGPGSYESFLGGGTHNRIEFNAPYSAVLGGYYNVVRSNASGAAVLGGISSVAGGQFAIAAGHQAKAEHSGSIVLADGQYADFVSSKANEFAVRAAGGVRFETAGAGLTVDGMRLTSSGGGSENFWQLTGNAGTTAGVNFLGTTDEVALWLKVNNQPALRLFPDPLFQGLMLHSPNLVGGSPNNGITDGNAASVIAGGGTAAPLVIGLPWFGQVVSGGPNHIHSTLANVSGGGGNAVFGHGSAVGGGSLNRVQESAGFSVISGGAANQINTNSSFASISGGRSNEIGYFSYYATVGAGFANTATAPESVIAGGTSNLVDTTAGVISGGQQNRIEAGATAGAIGGGFQNKMQRNSAHSTIAGGEQNWIFPDNSHATISGGGGSWIQSRAHYASVGGGIQQTIRENAYAATIGGGDNNLVNTNANYATIPGGARAYARDYGQLAYASGNFAANGDAQTSVHVLRGLTTTPTTPAELFLDGIGQRMKVPPNAVWTFDVLVVASSAEAGFLAGYQIRGVVANLFGSTGELGPPVKTVLYETEPAWDVNVVGDDPHSALVIRANGVSSSGKPVRWVASVRTVEVIF